MLTKRFATIQILLGLSGIGLVLVSYVVFSERLIEALDRVDRIAIHGELQLEQSQDLLIGVKDVVAELEASATAHQKTIDSAMESTARLSKTIGRWESDATAFAEISRDASRIVNTFQQQLPITVPNVDVSSRTVRFKRPEIELEADEFTVQYPSFTVDTRTESIDLGVKKLDLKYPVGLTTTQQNKKVRIADIPKVTLVDQQVDVPRIDVSYQDVLTAERALLLDTSRQLAATSASLDDTAGSLADLRELMAGDLSGSLRQTKGNLTGVARQLRQLHMQRIPGAITDLRDQREELRDSRAAWSALSELVPVAFVILGLLPVSILLSGLGNLSVARAERRPA